MRARVALLALALALAGCSQRERANPFDPGNPATGGRPANFAALAGNGTVKLQWSAASAPELIGYEVYRRIDGDTAWVPITGIIPPPTSEFIDVALANGVDHHYRVRYVFTRGPSSLWAEDVATPGPLVPWVSDAAEAAVYRITADGRHIAERLRLDGAGGPMISAGDLGVDPTDGTVWVLDPDGRSVSIYDPVKHGTVVATPNLANPAVLAIDPVSHMAWVGDDISNTGQVVELLPSGSLVTRIQNASRPIGVAVDPGDQSLWICERDVNQVMHLDASMNLIAITPVIAPTRVAVDSATHEAWVTSYSHSKVLRLAADGARIDSVGGILGPVGIAIDPRRGRIWVADFDGGQVIALRRSGAVEVAITRLGGATFLAVDLASGEVWATLQTARAVVRLSASGSGSVLRQVGGFTVPYGIGLYAGP